MIKQKTIIIFILTLVLFSCQTSTETKTEKSNREFEASSMALSEEFKQHWFAGKAEIASYKLSQMRYAEAREGHAVLIFVKEPFLKNEQVKANSTSELSFDVLKLNATKKFNTGIYPYSIMQSTFSPLSVDAHAVKVTSSTQEWCGQTYMQLNNRDQFKISSHSYFEGEADQNLSLDQSFLENEIWTKLRIDPDKLPLGEQKVIPDFSYLRLFHKPIKAYDAEITQQNNNDTLVTTLKYKSLNRILYIYQENTFPYIILKWEEKSNENDKNFTTAVLRKRMMIDYWNKNSNTFTFLRDSLQLN
jgi:hypothetical protein